MGRAQGQHLIWVRPQHVCSAKWHRTGAMGGVCMGAKLKGVWAQGGGVPGVCHVWCCRRRRGCASWH